MGLIGKCVNAVGLAEQYERFSDKYKVLERYEMLKHRLGKPYHWTDFPTVIQIDANNHCGQKYCGVFCTYCYPQSQIARGKDHYAVMSDEVLKWVFKDIGKYGKNMSFWCDFLNGDGLDPDLVRVRSMGKSYAPKVPSRTFTCGTRPENALLLCNRNLDEINVTLSAHNDALYRKVHRGNKFAQVLETMNIITENRLPHQRLEVHYVVNQLNYEYMQKWLDLMKTSYPDWQPIFSPLVNTSADDPSHYACGTLSTTQQEDLITSIGKSFWVRDATSLKQPCVLWHNASINVHGELLQCCRWDKSDWNYGTAQQYIEDGLEFRDYWLMKMANHGRNPFCDRCNLKHSDWSKRQYDVKVKINLK